MIEKYANQYIAYLMYQSEKVKRCCKKNTFFIELIVKNKLAISVFYEFLDVWNWQIDMLNVYQCLQILYDFRNDNHGHFTYGEYFDLCTKLLTERDYEDKEIDKKCRVLEKIFNDMSCS